MEQEVKAYMRAIDALLAEKLIERSPTVIFVCSNKSSGAKFFTGDNLQKPSQAQLKNPEPGTIIDKEITCGKDFYLISQKTTQGTAAPTHYFILGNMINKAGVYENVNPDETTIRNVEMLTYKMCYLYYNWTGSIKVPAPIQYAQKLGQLIGDRWKQEKPMIPDNHFQKVRSLFFI